MPRSQLRLWVHGLIAAFVSGGASAVTTAFTAPMFAPDELNFAGHPWRLLALMLATFVTSGFFGTMLYLRQSPVPPIEDDAQEQAKPAAAAAGGGK